MNKVITIGREFGSGGRELGRKLADELGYAYYDSEIIKQIVDKTELSEKYVKEIVEGKNHHIIPITIGHTLSYNYNFDYNVKGLQEVYKAQTDVIKEMAQISNCVIVGRCADYILVNEDVELMRIFVYASMDDRIKRCMARANDDEKDMTEKDMQKYIRRIDRLRSAYYEDYTLQKWGDKVNYDVCINTGNVDIDKLVPQLAKLFR